MQHKWRIGTDENFCSAKTIIKLLKKIGGGKRDRTADLLHAMQALSQLSYTPTRGFGSGY
jgi:hypothetical protein